LDGVTAVSFLVFGPYCGGDVPCLHTHLDALLLVTLVEVGYLLAVRHARRKFGASAVSQRHIVYFTLGVLVLFLGAGTPIHDISEQYLFSVHMFQHTIFTLVAPPLMLLGIAEPILQPIVENSAVLRGLRSVTQPLVAFVIFNLITLVTHLPFAVDFSLRNHPFHFVIHVILVLAALLMWWPVLSPLKEIPRLSPPFQMGFLFIQSLVPTVLTAFIIFAGSSIYAFYRDAPRIWGTTAVSDQQIAGAVMKLIGGLILWVAIGIIFFHWYGQEEEKERDPLRWEDVESELSEMGLTRRS
jgi:putative membrane protein